MKNSNQTTNVIGALLVGVFTGAIIGLLFAPDKGSKTRDKITGKTKHEEEELLKRLKEDIIAFRSRADEIEKQTKSMEKVIVLQ